MTAPSFALSSLEIAAGVPLGHMAGAAPLPDHDGATPRLVLEQVLADALRHPPCLVLFSGGRDSSALLAVADRVARTRDLARPVAFTHRYPGVPEAAEDEWQEAVIRHLGIVEWERVDVDDEFDWLGTYATRIIRRHGVIWPPNASTLGLAAERAGGGTVITGIFGDELFQAQPRQYRLRRVLAREVRPTMRDVARIGVALLPAPLERRIVTRRRIDPEHIAPWLTSSARSRVVRHLADSIAREPIRKGPSLRAWWRERYPHLLTASMGLVASEFGASAIHPLGDPRFVAAVAASGPVAGYPTRAEAMAALVGDLLPDHILTRTSKAVFDRAFWNRHSASFVQSWDGTGIDTDLVDPAILHRTWRSAVDPQQPSTRGTVQSVMLLQAAWHARDQGNPA